jgi:hypothetical protein
VPGKPGDRLRKAFLEEGPAREPADRLASEITQEVYRILVEAYINRQRFSAVNRWLQGALPPLFQAHARDPYALLNALRAFHIPDRLSGRLKRRKITDADLSVLFCKYEALKQKVAKVARGKVLKFQALWEGFPELPPQFCDPPGRFFPEKFAKQALAHEFGCKIPTIEKALTRARKAHQ